VRTEEGREGLLVREALGPVVEDPDRPGRRLPGSTSRELHPGRVATIAPRGDPAPRRLSRRGAAPLPRPRLDEGAGAVRRDPGGRGAGGRPARLGKLELGQVGGVGTSGSQRAGRSLQLAMRRRSRAGMAGAAP